MNLALLVHYFNLSLSFGKIASMVRSVYCFLLISMVVTSCSSASRNGEATATPERYNPFVPLNSGNASSPGVGGTNSDAKPGPTKRSGPTPTLAPLQISMQPTRLPGMPLASPTPDSPRVLPTPRLNADQHVVQAGDTLGSIAQQYGVSIETLTKANNLSDADLLSVGDVLDIPAPQVGKKGTDFKIIPDSELVYGPASVNFDTKAFIENEGGFLATYTEEVHEEILTGAQIITLVAENYSVNPRLLLALLEHQSGWVTDPSPPYKNFPLGLADPWHEGLYRQLTWAANTLNRSYYLWQVNALSTWVLADGNVVPIDPTINAGTAAVQGYFASIDDLFTWQGNVTAFGVFQTYFFLFGNPFDLAIEPLVPVNLYQPYMQLPFEPEVTWSYTGGPHGGWDSGSAWAALDFGPPGETAGCFSSDEWVVAVADGWIVRTGEGIIMQDLDGDGYEQTGWVVFYMHVETRDRIEAKNYVYAGDRLGHPSCEGGLSNGTHLHIARKYNGEWIPADGRMPFILDGWISSGNGIEYDGFLKKGEQTVEAWDGRNEQNQIER